MKNLRDIDLSLDTAEDQQHIHIALSQHCLNRQQGLAM